MSDENIPVSRLCWVEIERFFFAFWWFFIILCIMKNELHKIKSLIHEIRGHRVMLDSDLAELYEVEVKRLNESVKRNIKRFPLEFMFQLTDVEWHNLRSQIATFNKDTRKYKPYVFTEHGVLMLSSVLNLTGRLM